MSKPSVIIIGAGAAGLIAARELSPEFETIVLEADHRIGGRLHSISQQGNLMEAGAEFIHGRVPVTLGLLKEANIQYVQTEGEMYRSKNGQFSNVNEMTEGWDGLLRKMGDIKEDTTMQALLDEYYPGAENELLRLHVKSFAEGFDGADITKASVKELYREWNGEDFENYRIPGGYSSLATYLRQKAEASGAVFFTGDPVKKVDWQIGNVTVYTENGKTYTAAKLILTIPVSLLQKPGSGAYIQFVPPVHFDEKVAADIGFGAVIKVIFKFKKAFWQQDAGFILSDELFPTWWTQLPDKKPLLTGWLGGPKAAALSGETDEGIHEKALASLAAIYDVPVDKLKEELDLALIFNWQKNEYTRGAYSYSTPASARARKIINAPLMETIFFAGEALYTGDHPGTVEAALVSGIATAAMVKKYLNQGRD